MVASIEEAGASSDIFGNLNDTDFPTLTKIVEKSTWGCEVVYLIEEVYLAGVVGLYEFAECCISVSLMDFRRVN